MARLETRYVCGTCGATSLRWEGQCRSCGEWNTLVESVVERATASASARRSRAPVAAPSATPLSSLSEADTDRLVLGIRELDRVLGGGIVAGSLVLLGGEPGIGKSTLVLAICGAVARADPHGRVLYASGEESAAQLRMRATRLGLVGSADAERIDVLPETSVERIVAAAEASAPALLVVDSIQTLTTDDLEGPRRIRRAGSRRRGAPAGTCQGAWSADDPRWPRDQGRHARGAEDAGARRRRGADTRGRALLGPAPASIEQEPLRLDRRGGRLRDGR